MPITQSAADIRGSTMHYTTTGKTLKKVGNITYMDRIPGFYKINTDIFKYITKKVPRHRLKEFRDILYNFLNEEKPREELDDLIKEFTRKNIEQHNRDFSRIVKKQTIRKKAGKRKKKKKPSKKETLYQRSRRLRRQRESKRKKKKEKKSKKKKKKTKRKKNDRTINK